MCTLIVYVSIPDSDQMQHRHHLVYIHLQLHARSLSMERRCSWIVLGGDARVAIPLNLLHVGFIPTLKEPIISLSESERYV